MAKIYEIKNGEIYIYVKVQPKSSKNRIAGLYSDMLKINVKAPAVEGAANKELIKFISKEFNVSKSEVKIKGEKSKRKVLILPFKDDIINKLSQYK